MNTQTVILDVDKRYDPSQVVTIGQGDKSGTTIVAEVYDKGVSVSLGGYTAEFEMRLPDGRNYVRDNDCTVSGNTITYVVDEEHCGAAAGHTNECYFNIKSGTSVIYSTSRFRMDVLRAAHDGAVPSESWDSAIEEAIENANEAAEEAREAAGGTVPLMTASYRGGAKLGDGLALIGEALGVDPLTTTDVDTVTSDGSLTSSKALTGTMLTYLWSKIKSKFASLVNGAVSVAQGGTGATTAALARTNLDAAQSNGASGTLKAAEDEIDALEASLAYVESTTARTNHAVGDYFMLGNVLMKATAAIATGETINASKATPATVQSQIDTLRDSVGTAIVSPRLSRMLFSYDSDDSAPQLNYTLQNGRNYIISFRDSKTIEWGYWESGTWHAIRALIAPTSSTISLTPSSFLSELVVGRVRESEAFFAVSGTFKFSGAHAIGDSFNIFTTSLRNGGIVVSDWLAGSVSPSTGIAYISNYKAISAGNSGSFSAILFK